MPVETLGFRHSFKLDGKEVDYNLDRLRTLIPYLNVKGFGAVGDGVTDDYVAIQKALSSANTKGGGVVFFPTGTYIVGTSLIIYSNTAMLGESYGGVTLEAKSTLTDRMLQNQARLGSGTDEKITIENIIFDESGQDTAPTFARIDDLLIHRCSFINGSSGLFLLTGATYDDNHHCYVVDCIFDSSNLVSGGTDINDWGNGKDIQIIRSKFIGGFTSSNSPQISAAGMTDFIIRDCWFDGQHNACPISIFGVNGGGIYDCEILNSGGFGIKIARFTEGTPDAEIFDFNVQGNRIHDGGDYGIWLRQESAATDLVYRTNISNNWIYNCPKNALLVEVCDGLHFTHNFVYNNSYGNVGTYYALEFNNPSSTVAVKNIIVDFNRFYDTQGTPSQTKLIKLNYVDNFHSFRNDITNITTKYTVTNSTNFVFDDGDNTSFIGVLTRVITAASGSVAYTGVGFKPKSLIFFAGNGASLSWGMDNVTAHGNIYTYGAGFTDSAATSIGIDTGAGVGQTGVVTSLDADGFTIAWTKNGAPAGFNINVYYLAVR